MYYMGVCSGIILACLLPLLGALLLSLPGAWEMLGHNKRTLMMCRADSCAWASHEPPLSPRMQSRLKGIQDGIPSYSPE